ncbi:MAG: nucleotidyltransferase family protein [Alphaproteobacteria bacterium]|nr:nucleotidyltransferase family protein [Alphaproteobacteria bacterium]
MWGVMPAAGMGLRQQLLTGSKELVPVGPSGRRGGARPVADYLVERMRLGGATRLCVVIAPGKTDLVAHYRDATEGLPVAYVAQPSPAGLCDALFRARCVMAPREDVLIGLPDTVWFPKDGFARLPAGGVSLLCFPVADPSAFDAVETAGDGETVTYVRVKRSGPRGALVWGALRCSGPAFADLHATWRDRAGADVPLGGVLNAYMANGGRVRAVAVDGPYFDIGTPSGLAAANAALARAGLGQ